MPVSRKTMNERAAIPGFPMPHWSSPGAMLYLGDVREQLRRLPTRSVHCCVTSPPYWGLRDYGTGTWEGGSAGCDHESARQKGRADYGFSDKCQVQAANPHAGFASYGRSCPSCGATRVDRQLGMEEVPDCLGWATKRPCGECYVCHMVEVFAEVRRALRDDGVCWLNLGDTIDGEQFMVPERVAMALVADGWLLVKKIVWYSPNKMPESASRRCTKSHEYIFHLAKGPKYFYDGFAIMEQAKSSWTSESFLPNSEKDAADDGRGSAAAGASRSNRNSVVRGKRNGGRWFGKLPTDAKAAGAQHREYDRGDDDLVNKRDVWVVPTQGYPGAHFAVFSPMLITPCILAGTSECGCCARCGAPYERVVARVGAVKTDGELATKHRDRSMERNRNGVDSTLDTGIAVRETAGWRKSCGCQCADVAPCVVMDPFVGSGTTVATSLELGRRGVGIDLSEKYLRENAVPRIEAAMRGEKVVRPMKLAVGVPPPRGRVR